MRDDIEDSAGDSDWVTDLAFFGMACMAFTMVGAIVVLVIS